jgi:FkbM family methyltransferase
MTALDTDRIRVKDFGESGLRIAYREDTVDERAIGPWMDWLGGAAPNPLELPADGVILDIGAHIGGFALPASRMVPDGLVLAVEACRESHEILAYNVELNGLTNVQTAHLALSDGSGQVRLNYDPAGNWGHTITKSLDAGGEPVPTQALAGFLRENRVDRCALAKFNCEGAEFPILMGASTETLRTIRRMLILYHGDLIDDRYDLGRLERHLEKARFELQRHKTHGERGRILADRANDAPVHQPSALAAFVPTASPGPDRPSQIN